MIHTRSYISIISIIRFFTRTKMSKDIYEEICRSIIRHSESR